MKFNVYTPMLVVFLAAGFFVETSCGNAAKKTGSGTSDSAAEAQVSYQQKVHHFDSTWKETFSMINVRITQWDSSAKTYRGSLGDRMEEKVQQVKKERDSLENLLGRSADQTQESWDGFQQSVRDQYDAIVETLTELGSLNQ